MHSYWRAHLGHEHLLRGVNVCFWLPFRGLRPHERCAAGSTCSVGWWGIGRRCCPGWCTPAFPLGFAAFFIIKDIIKDIIFILCDICTPQEQFFKLADFKGAHLFLPELDAAMIFYFSKNGA